MKCIIGLGNIGKEYENTRHNLGFMALDYLCEKYGISLNKKGKKCIYGEGIINNNKVSFVKPTTYMNLSGDAVVQIMNWYKIDTKDILIIYDDVDIPLGEIRYRTKGSGGTHNGMKHIISTIKTEEFARIRIGMENRKEQVPLIDYVLERFNEEELRKIKEEILPVVEENVCNFIDNKVN